MSALVAALSRDGFLACHVVLEGQLRHGQNAEKRDQKSESGGGENPAINRGEIRMAIDKGARIDQLRWPDPCN